MMDEKTVEEVLAWSVNRVGHPLPTEEETAAATTIGRQQVALALISAVKVMKDADMNPNSIPAIIFGAACAMGGFLAANCKDAASFQVGENMVVSLLRDGFNKAAVDMGNPERLDAATPAAIAKSHIMEQRSRRDKRGATTH